MKSLRICLLGTLFMVLLASCCPPQHHVTIGWDEPDSPLGPGQEFRYMVYLDIDQDNTHDDKMRLFKDHIKERKFKMNRHYFVGVEAVLFENGEKVPGTIPSGIAWSSSKEDTNEAPFDVDIKK
jgi:hypothetical protein